jgi:hypothetical protein
LVLQSELRSFPASVNVRGRCGNQATRKRIGRQRARNVLSPTGSAPCTAGRGDRVRRESGRSPEPEPRGDGELFEGMSEQRVTGQHTREMTEHYSCFALIDFGVETRALNQAVTKSPERFSKDFMFRLITAEALDLRSQSVISNRGGRRSLPNAFTEHGILMLSDCFKTALAKAAASPHSMPTRGRACCRFGRLLEAPSRTRSTTLSTNPPDRGFCSMKARCMSAPATVERTS